MLRAFSAFLLVLAFLGIGCSKPPVSGSGAETPALKELIIALKPDKDPEAMLAERASLEKHLAREMGIPVKVIIPLTSTVILEGFGNGTVDLGYLSSTDMLNARREKVAHILLAGEIDGRTSYTSYWLALKVKPYTSVADLRGKPISFASKTSSSGYIVPLAALVRKGFLKEKANPEDFFGKGNVSFGTGYTSVVERVLNGDSEACAVSYYVLDKDKHLTPEQRALLKKIDEQGPVPTHVLAIRSSLPPEHRARILKAFQAFNKANPELRDKIFTSPMVEVDEEAHLKPLEEDLRMTGMIP